MPLVSLCLISDRESVKFKSPVNSLTTPQPHHVWYRPIGNCVLFLTHVLAQLSDLIAKNRMQISEYNNPSNTQVNLPYD